MDIRERLRPYTSYKVKVTPAALGSLRTQLDNLGDHFKALGLVSERPTKTNEGWLFAAVPNDAYGGTGIAVYLRYESIVDQPQGDTLPSLHWINKVLKTTGWQWADHEEEGFINLAFDGSKWYALSESFRVFADGKISLRTDPVRQDSLETVLLDRILSYAGQFQGAPTQRVK